jgi:hypothetical protein
MATQTLVNEVEEILDGEWAYGIEESAGELYEIKNENGGNGNNAYC